MPTLSIDQHVQVEQLTQWPKDTPKTDPEDRTSGPFPKKGGGHRQITPIVERTINDLEHELRQLGVEEAVLQVDLPPGEIRNRDGLPYQRSNPEPAVVLTFEDEQGVQTYPADSFDDWTQNFRAIVKTLEALRKIQRYGVGRGDEQYQGFRGIPADVDEQIGPEEAARILVATAGFRSDPEFDDRVQQVLEDESEATDYLRMARKMSHPDRKTGNEDSFKRVQTAADILRQYHDGQGGTD